MRQSAATAEVGDDVYREDPTVNKLEARAAELVDKEAALFVPSGTMGNQIAARTHTERGQEILIESESHIYKWELGGLAQHSDLQTRPIDAAPRGVIEPDQIFESHVEGDSHRPGTGLVCLENTHNSYGGTAIAPEDVDAIGETATELGLPVHLDGARIGNAAVAHGVPVSRMTQNVDSIMFCLSKGLGAPIGSMLAGSEKFIEQARKNRKLYGGGMRQGGIIAGPGLRALDNIERLSEDHENASGLAAGLNSIDGLSTNDPETNIILVETTGLELTAEAVLDRIAEEGILATEFGEHVIRFCTHWDLDSEDITTAIRKIKQVLD
jgi:threonine aldolase